MDAATYPQKPVIEFMSENMIALRVSFDSALAKEFKVTWTPTLVTLDWSGQEHHRTVGFLPAEELIASLLLASGKVFCDIEQFDRASAPLERLISAHSGTGAAPEAMFVRGVCGYKSTHATGPLKAAYEQLQKHYPDSEWTKRAQPYSLL
jgi:hypothetical protein